MKAPDAAANDVAIIGMSGRFPGAATVDEFWDNVRNGRESISRFSKEEAIEAGVDPRALGYPGYVNAGGVLQDIDLFDAGFFGFSARDAEITDPQHRIFLECAWEALEDGGYDPAAFDGPIGVFGGVAMSRYAFNLYSNPELMAAVGQLPILLATDKDHLTTRVAYKLNLSGPAVTVQSACSTSLVAVVLVYQNLLEYHCDMALAGGVTILIPQKAGYVYQPGGISSPDGHCRAFDADAMGTVGGNGAGVVLLKRYEDALAAGDAVHAVIRGAAINNDGSVKVGYTAPSVAGQAAVIAMAQAIAGVSAETIGYIEAHGTGTPLGDPIEIAALTQAFRAHTAKTGFCAIGSVKTNVGHLDCAAGVAGLIKTVMALKHRELPPSLHFRRPNPRIELDSSPFFVNARRQPWTSPDGCRRAGVSSFGIGGTNAHVVLEEAPAPVATDARPLSLLPLSARSPSALEAVTQRLSAFLASEQAAPMPDIAYTAAVGRPGFAHRRALVVRDAMEARGALTGGDPSQLRAGVARAAKAVFMFPGQGAQHPDMGLDLLRHEPGFREHAERCAALFRPHLGLDLLTIVYPPNGSGTAAATELERTALAQPALFMVEYALARLLQEWGITPHAMIGHSIGEYVAACLSGVFTLESAIELVAARGRLMQQMPPGAMLAVSMNERETAAELDRDLDLAVINGPLQCVVSGPVEAVDRLESRLQQRRVPCRRIRTSHAFHSRHMTEAAERLLDTASGIPLREPQIPFLSSLTGDWITGAQATDRAYWASQLRRPVRFGDGLDRLVTMPDWMLLEVGPGVGLSTFARQHPDRRAEQLVVAGMRHPRDSRSDELALLDAVAQLWSVGVDIDWSGFYARERRHRVHLPTYPFERERYWIDPVKPEAAPATPSSPDSEAPVRSAPEKWLYRPAWQTRALDRAPIGNARRTWLVLSDTRLGPALVRRIRSTGDVAVCVAASAHTDPPGADRAIRPDEPGDYLQLLHDLQSQGLFPDRIVHLWSLSGPDDEQARPQTLGFFSLLALAQAIAKQSAARPLQLLVAADGLHAVGPSDRVVPEHATVVGPVRVIPQELPHVWSRCVDLPHVLADGERSSLVDALCREFDDVSPHRMVAYRGGERLVETIESISGGAGAPLPLRQGGSYVITGGTGGIGLALAERLAREVGARLTLVGRTRLPERERWNASAGNGEGADRTARTIERIRAVEAAGGEVLVSAADVTDIEALGAALRAARERFGHIHGVIHAAGVAGGGMLQRRTAAAARAVLAPKLEGTLALERLLAGQELDFVVLCSSLASRMGGFGQIDYCAANAFLDAYAEAASSRLRAARVVAIAWDTWREAGMAVDTPVPQELMASRQAHLMAGLTNEEGARVFLEVLRHPYPGALVSTRPLQERLAASAAPAAPAPAPAAIPAAAARHPRPTLATALVSPRNAAESTIASVWEETLGVSPIGVDDDFFDLGGHSLLAIQVVARLREKLDVEVPVQALFDAPTVAQLAAHVDSLAGAVPTGLAEMIDYVGNLSDEEVERLLSSRRRGPGA